jgi:hypothetical protein
MTVSTIITDYHATEFLSQLSTFLMTLVPTQQTETSRGLINEQLLVPAFRQVVLRLPCIPELASEPTRDVRPCST